DQGYAAEALDGFDDAAQSAVRRLDRLDYRGDHAAVPDHVRVREIDDRKAVAVVLELFTKALRDFEGGHSGLFVVGADLARARDEDPRLAGPLVLTAAVEEVGDVRVFLGLGRVELPDVVLGEHLRQRLVDLPLAER